MRRAGAWLVGGLCAYEVTALATGRVPTISRACWWLRKQHPLGGVAIWTALGVLSWHLLVDEDA
jgi:hypothetical protein